MRHLTEEDLDLFVTKLIPANRIRSVEAHLAGCATCRMRLDETREYIVHLREAISEIVSPFEVHHTSDGPIELRVYPLRGGGWQASLAGTRKLNSGAVVKESKEEAEECIRTQFHEMFPEHFCSDICHIEGSSRSRVS